MSRMRANIATARRNWRPQVRSLPASHVTRDENGRVCPACRRFGRESCRKHRSEVSS